MQNITFTLDPASRVPLYEQLYKYLVGEIHAGRLRREEKLPSKRAISAHLGVSMSTVETAYELLTAEGYVTARPRSGYYVSDFISLEAPAPAPASAPEREERSERPERPLYDLSTASVDTGLFPYAFWARLNREVVYSSPELLQRGDRRGDLALRQALAAFLAEYRGVSAPPEAIVVGAGMEYLAGLLMSLFPRETVFAAEDPGYAALVETAVALGREVRFIPLDGHGMRVDELRRSGATVAYLTPSHQFPMGVTMPASRRSHLLQWAAEGEGRYLIEDDYDSEFRYASRPVSAMQGMDGGRVVYMGTFSRSLAPSIRVAYMVLPPALLERYERLSGYRLSTVSRYEQQVLARFLAEGAYARYLRRVGNLYRGREEKLTAALRSLPGAEITGDGAGLHFLLTLDRYPEGELVRRAGEAGAALRGLSTCCHAVAPRPSTLLVGFGGLEDGKIGALTAALAAAWA